MNPDVEKLVHAAWQDARRTWSSVTLEYMQEQASRILAGERPQGGPGVFLEDIMRRAKLDCQDARAAIEEAEGQP